MHITLRAGEKLYLNGAVLRADRKVSLELMNDATFLLEAHVMSVEKATTPIRQLYFIIQMMLMSPNDTTEAQKLFSASMPRMVAAYDDRLVKSTLIQVEEFVAGQRYFDALKLLRGCFAHDDSLLVAPPRFAMAS